MTHAKVEAALPGEGRVTDLTTVHLGQFTDEHANAIAGKLEERGIAWWYKQPGYFSRIWERGTRLFVDATHIDEARSIAKDVLGGGEEDQTPPPG